MSKHIGRKPFTHLTQYDRDRIEEMRFHGIKRVDIARILGRDKGTISRELRKYTNKHQRYNATKAQKSAEAARKGSKAVGMKIEKYPKLRARIISELKALRAPDEIAGRMKQEQYFPRVGTNAIYKWLYSAHGKAYCPYLCTKKVHKLSQSHPSMVSPQRDGSRGDTRSNLSINALSVQSQIPQVVRIQERV